jgi:hypothetical protein
MTDIKTTEDIDKKLRDMYKEYENDLVNLIDRENLYIEKRKQTMQHAEAIIAMLKLKNKMLESSEVK